MVPRSDTAHPPLMKEADVLAAEDRLRRAMLASNVAELENLLAPELLFVTHMGQVISRGDDLDAHRAGMIQIASLEVRETQVRFAAENAVVLATVDISGTFAGNPASGRFRFLRVWALGSAGELRVIAGQASLL